AAARGAEQHHQFAAVEREVDAAQRLHLDLAHVVDLGETAGDEDGAGLFGRHGSIMPRVPTGGQRVQRRGRCSANHSAARCATDSSVPGSSNRWVAPGTITISFWQRSWSYASWLRSITPSS